LNLFLLIDGRESPAHPHGLLVRGDRLEDALGEGLVEEAVDAEVRNGTRGADGVAERVLVDWSNEHEISLPMLRDDSVFARALIRKIAHESLDPRHNPARLPPRKWPLRGGPRRC